MTNNNTNKNDSTHFVNSVQKTLSLFPIYQKVWAEFVNKRAPSAKHSPLITTETHDTAEHQHLDQRCSVDAYVINERTGQRIYLAMRHESKADSPYLREFEEPDSITLTHPSEHKKITSGQARCQYYLHMFLDEQNKPTHCYVVKVDQAFRDAFKQPWLKVQSAGPSGHNFVFLSAPKLKEAKVFVDKFLC